MGLIGHEPTIPTASTSTRREGGQGGCWQRWKDPVHIIAAGSIPPIAFPPPGPPPTTQVPSISPSPDPISALYAPADVVGSGDKTGSTATSCSSKNCYYNKDLGFNGYQRGTPYAINRHFFFNSTTLFHCCRALQPAAQSYLGWAWQSQRYFLHTHSSVWCRTKKGMPNKYLARLSCHPSDTF